MNGPHPCMLRRYIIAISVILTCSYCLAGDKAFGPTDLTYAVKPFVPDGWSISIKEQDVVLERHEEIEVYNALQLPSTDDQEIRRHMKKSKLTISLRIERRMSQQEYEDIVAQNKIAYKRARKDNPKQIFFRPDSQYWRDHPEYNYYFQDLPSFDLGHHSVVMISEPRSAVFVGRRVVRAGGGNYVLMFKDAKVEAECQGVVDSLGTAWRTYLRGVSR